MNKELIKELILENQRFIGNIELIKRDYEIFDRRRGNNRGKWRRNIGRSCLEMAVESSK